MELQSENINEITEALIKAQKTIKPVALDCINPFFKSKYADFASVMDAVKDPLGKNDIALTQSSAPVDGKSYIVTQLSHKSGQWVRGYYPVIHSVDDPQKFGAATTYAKRYALSAMLGVVADEDDDGNVASASTSYTPASTSPPKEPDQDLKDLVDGVRPHAAGSDFLTSVIGQFDQRGTLSAGQRTALEKTYKEKNNMAPDEEIPKRTTTSNIPSHVTEEVPIDDDLNDDIGF